jgi:hypothetical protein
MSIVRRATLMLALLTQLDCTVHGNAQVARGIDSVTTRRNVRVQPVSEKLPPASVMQYPPQEVP